MFILVFGIGFQQKVAYAAFTTTFVVLMSAPAAVESVKQDHLLVARSYGATRMQILPRVYVPSMLPILLETLRISMIFNFTGVMIAEMYASRTGIGHLIASWGENFQMKQLFAGVILLAAAAILFNEARALAGGAGAARGGHERTARPDRRRRSRSSAEPRLRRARCVPRWRTSPSASPPGRFTVIVGPSGCGKTSLLMMLAGLRAQSRGHASICLGKPIPAPDPQRVGVIFQEASLYPWLTALENIEFPLSLRGTPTEDVPPPRRGHARAGRPGRLRRALSARALRAA